MSTKNKKSVASQALLEMDAITSAIKEESKNTLNTLLSEAVRNALRESCEEEEDKEYDIEEEDADNNEENSEEGAKSDVAEDGNPEMEPEIEGGEEPEVPMGQPGEMQPDSQEAPVDGEGEESLEDYSEYQTDDNTYDLTGENDYEKVVKVFKLLNGDDNIVVRKDNNTINLKDNEAGTEYVIDLGAGDDEMTADSVEGEEIENPEMNINESDIAGFGDELDNTMEDDEFFGEEDFFDDEEEFDDIEREYDEDTINFLYGNNNIHDTNGAMGMLAQGDPKDPSTKFAKALKSNMADSYAEFAGSDFENEDSENNLYENRKSRKPMKGSKEVLFEVDLGYTDNYQDKDPIAGLSNNEPSKSGKSWHKGVPTGTQKPWAGETKSKGQPFEKTVNEEDGMAPEMDAEMPVAEATNVGGAVQQRSSSKTNMPKGRKEYGPKVKRHVSTAGEYESLVNENKKLKAEVKSLKEAILAIRKNLSEAYVTNANLGKITKLFLENTTSQAEKVDIVNRFSNEAKTIEQSKALYESIKRELSKTNTSLNINESVTANGTKMINEEKVYKTDDLIKTIDLMRRITNY